MSDKTTGAMRQFGSGTDPEADGTGKSAGLVLLYAEGYESLPPALQFDQRVLAVGSDPTVPLPLPVNAVSRKHAEFRYADGSWTVRDLDSRNGTLLDGHPIREARLESGAELRFGDAILKFVESHAAQYATFRLDGVMVSGGRRRCQSGTALVGGYQLDRMASEIERIAPTELSVMLLGESGTGKEIVARELHRLSGRRGGFSAVNCAAIPGNLLESELFGYKRGAFTGAARDKPGLIHAADEGTLLLDEIGDMPLEAQAKLLRVLQNQEVFPLGATAPERVDVRVVCATHRDLWRLQKAGSYREDLFARLNEYQLRLPPLRDRKEDILMLLRVFLVQQDRPDLRPSFDFMTALLQHDWPYNVRELESCVKRCIALAETPLLVPAQLPDVIQEAMREYGRPASTRRDSTARIENGDDVEAGGVSRGAPTEAELRALLTEHQGNVAAVGRDLGKARMQIHRWMHRYGIQVEDFR
jgi:DNA-binding NtrC family response regulator